MQSTEIKDTAKLLMTSYQSKSNLKTGLFVPDFVFQTDLPSWETNPEWEASVEAKYVFLTTTS